MGYEDSDHPGVGWRYLYDGACRRVGKEQINTTTGEVTSRVMFLHEGDVLFGEYYTVNTMDPHVVGSARLWPTDPGTGEILGQITINTNTTGSVTGYGGGNGYYPGGYSGDTGGHNNADDPYYQHNNPHGGYSGGPYNHNDSTTGDGAGGVLGWPQEHVDAVFYSMVCDLAGAPKELINPTTGEVVGYATYTLFGKRQWAGMVSTPLLFTGQYEDTESGWVYNRFRYYDPHAGVYNAQDPLGLLANLGTTQGYVTNPVIYVDFLGLNSHPKIKSFNDVLRDPYLLKDVKDGEELGKLVNDPIYDPLPEGVAPPKEWVGKTMWEKGIMHHARFEKGTVYRQMVMHPKGANPTGQQIQYHPGSRRHFNKHPYWKVTRDMSRKDIDFVGSKGVVRLLAP